MENDISARLKANISRIRKENGLKQNELAEMMGVPAPFYNRIELQKVEPTISSLLKVAEALKVDIVDFFEPLETGDLSFLEKCQKAEGLPIQERNAIEQFIDVALIKQKMEKEIDKGKVAKRRKELGDL